MMSYGIIYGLMSFLMPSVFPFIFILGIVSQKLSISHKMYWVNTLLVLFSVSLTYQIVIMIGLEIDVLNILLGALSFFNFWFVSLFLLLSVYLIGFFDLNNSLKIFLGLIVSLTLGVKVSLLALSSSGPILGSLLASKNDNSIELVDFIKGEGLVICLVLLIIMIVSRKISQKFKEKSWSDNIPKLLGLYLFITQIISIVSFFNT